jgi:Tol biopolymer transport system component
MPSASCGQKPCRTASPQRLTTRSGKIEYQPSFSADGKKLLYTTWSDEKQGTIVERDLASGSERARSPQSRVSTTAALFARWLEDRLCRSTSGSSLTGNLNSGETGHLSHAGRGR